MRLTHRTGAIWDRSPRTRSQIVRRVCEALEKEYGHPRLGNPERPVDDLVYIVISNRTSPQVAQRTYARIKSAFATWDDLAASPATVLWALLQPAGLALVKSQQMHGALRKIRDDFGSCELGQLGERSETEILEYLTSLPGVSEKVARCVMMYTMGAEVLPVDAHVHRVARRLGWTARKRADQCHAELEALVPPRRRYAFHIGCILHGRAVCRPRGPDCDCCCIGRHCTYHGSSGDS